jgi:hypothetical protein
MSSKNNRSKLSLKSKNSILFGLVLLCLQGLGQDKSPVTFGEVGPEDFANPDAIDSSAGAVVVADVGGSNFVRSGFIGQFDCYLLFRQSKRIHIVAHNGFAAATVAIPLLEDRGDKEEVTGLTGTTYNLENGKVVATPLDKASIFTEKVSESEWVEKFTFPGVREGSIVEYSYTVKSPFLASLHSWLFQDKYPCRWSEYKVAVPDLFSYLTLEKGNPSYFIHTMEGRDSSFGNYRMGTSTIELKTMILTSRWVMKDVAAFHEEPYTTSIYNYVARVEFQFVSFNLMGVFSNRNLPSWTLLSKSLLKSDKFGADLDADNSWLDKDLENITAGATDDVDKAKKIYGYVREHFAHTPNRGILLSHSLKTIFKSKTGSPCEINLLLIAMLDHAKLHAEPVILSTRSNGFLNPDVPLQHSVDYVVCKFWSDFALDYLDASDPDIGFGQLPLECYNEYGRSVDSTARNMDILSADGITEQERVTVMISNAEKGGLDASVQSYPGIAEATGIRKELRAQDGDKKFREKLQTELSAEGTISDLEIDSLRLPDEPLAVSYGCHLAPDTASKLFYFTPTLLDRLTENPFKAAERSYAVEMPYAEDRNYILTMDIPTGYEVEELPKSAMVRLVDSSAYFEYVLSQDGDRIQFRTRTRLLKANYKPEEYAILRDFFSAIVKKESEQIVFKKKK